MNVEISALAEANLEEIYLRIREKSPDLPFSCESISLYRFAPVYVLTVSSGSEVFPDKSGDGFSSR